MSVWASLCAFIKGTSSRPQGGHPACYSTKVGKLFTPESFGSGYYA